MLEERTRTGIEAAREGAVGQKAGAREKEAGVEGGKKKRARSAPTEWSLAARTESKVLPILLCLKHTRVYLKTPGGVVCQY